MGFSGTVIKLSAVYTKCEHRYSKELICDRFSGCLKKFCETHYGWFCITLNTM